VQPNPELLARGRALFAQYCVTCHGENGKGDGPAAASLKPQPRNFTQAAGWTNGPGRPAIFKTLANGVPGSAMVAYDFLTKKDRMALVHCVRSFAGSAERAESAESLSALEKELAAPGERVPNRIPVSTAGSRLIAAYASPPGPRVGPESPATLRAAVADGARVGRALAQSPDWRRSPEDLARVALADPATAGFRPEVAAFTGAEWRALLIDLRAAVVEVQTRKPSPTQGAGK
jgi:hypothetical protein